MLEVGEGAHQGQAGRRRNKRDEEGPLFPEEGRGEKEGPRRRDLGEADVITHAERESHSKRE